MASSLMLSLFLSRHLILAQTGAKAKCPDRSRIRHTLYGAGRCSKGAPTTPGDGAPTQHTSPCRNHDRVLSLRSWIIYHQQLSNPELRRTDMAPARSLNPSLGSLAEPAPRRMDCGPHPASNPPLTMDACPRTPPSHIRLAARISPLSATCFCASHIDDAFDQLTVGSSNRQAVKCLYCCPTEASSRYSRKLDTTCESRCDPRQVSRAA